MDRQVMVWLVVGATAIAGLCGIAWQLSRWRVRGRRHVVVDGSNVMYWKGAGPDLRTVREVVAELRDCGFVPGVIFDANAGHKLMGRYVHDGAMARMLGLPRKRVMVVDKGAVADQWILASARDLKARIVTNDRYRDWAGAHPEVAEPGFLIRGGYRDGKVWLGLE
jgi:hypothetical protein